MGAAPEIAAAAQAATPTIDFEVFEENWRAVSMFMRLQTQWVPSFAGVMGLRYQSIEFLFRIEGVADSDQRELFADLQVMEAAALELLNAKD